MGAVLKENAGVSRIETGKLDPARGLNVLTASPCSPNNIPLNKPILTISINSFFIFSSGMKAIPPSLIILIQGLRFYQLAFPKTACRANTIIFFPIKAL
jgi:hypothetical protein